MIGFLLVKVVIGNDDLKMQSQFHKRVCQEHKNKKEMLVGLDESNVCTNGLHRHFFTKWYFLKTFIRKSITKINNVPLYRIFPLNIAVHSCLTFIPYACQSYQIYLIRPFSWIHNTPSYNGVETQKNNYLDILHFFGG